MSSGIYVTKREQVEVEKINLAPVGLAQDNSNKLQLTKQLIWKTVPQLDENGKPRRQTNPLDQYGIQVTQVTIEDPQPEGAIEYLING